MRKWLVTAAVLTVSGISAFLLTEKGKESLRRWLAYLGAESGEWSKWNESAQRELERIQAAVDELARSLELQRKSGDDFAR